MDWVGVREGGLDIKESCWAQDGYSGIMVRIHAFQFSINRGKKDIQRLPPSYPNILLNHYQKHAFSVYCVSKK